MNVLTWGALVSVLIVGSAIAQEQQPPAQQGPPPGGAPHRMKIPDKFTNLKVLPKDIKKDDLVNAMRTFARSLGTRCEHCHVINDQDESKTDFSSDQKPEKDVARLMMKMTWTANNEFISKVKLPDDPPPKEINCWTCHRGKVKPETGPPPPPERPGGPGGPGGPPPTGVAQPTPKG